MVVAVAVVATSIGVLVDRFSRNYSGDQKVAHIENGKSTKEWVAGAGRPDTRLEKL
jgi:hypothetical protein